MNMKNPDKNALKEDYREIVHTVMQALNEWDPYDLIQGGAPEDEFAEEAALIAAKINQIETPTELGKVISDVFSKRFESAVFSVEVCLPVAYRLFSDLTPRVSLRFGQRTIIRKMVLEDLIEYRRATNELRSALAGFSWDAEEELIKLERQHVLAVLERYIRDDISSKEVEDWANLIECREDIGYEEVAAVLHILANPTITKELTKAVAAQLIEDLKTPNTPLEPSR